MLEDYLVSFFLGRYTQIIYDLGAVSEVVNPNSMVRTTLNKFTEPWGLFVYIIVERKAMPTWERMWDDFI
jgi:hypothetical protein